jgi:hypothetical protein
MPPTRPVVASLQFVAAPRSAEIAWEDGTRAQVQLTISEPRVFLVESTANPAAPNIAFPCVDHIVVRGQVYLTTSDGRLREHIGEFDLKSSGNFLSGTWPVAADDLEGTYAQGAAAQNECFLGTQIELVVSETAFTGTVIDSIANEACGDFADDTGVSPRTRGTWGG